MALPDVKRRKAEQTWESHLIHCSTRTPPSTGSRKPVAGPSRIGPSRLRRRSAWPTVKRWACGAVASGARSTGGASTRKSAPSASSQMTSNCSAFLRVSAMSNPEIPAQCSICGTEGVALPYETPNDPPFTCGGRHCQSCEDWLSTGGMDRTSCDICGEAYDPELPNAGDGWAEMYDPTDPDADSVTGHWSCGRQRGLEMA